MGAGFNHVQPRATRAETVAAKEAAALQKTRDVKVYLVAVNGAGKSGKKIGCGDSLVAVTRTIKATGSPLKAALQELVAAPHEDNGKLGNYVFGPDLKVQSVSVSKGTATIRFSGEISVAGICDEPRIVEQIEATAMQFPTVKRVKVFVGKQTLKEAIS
jgi:spore germination protein GerM